MKYFKDWHRILLDTTALCSLFRSENKLDGAVSDQDLFVRKLIEYLNKNKTSSGEERVFLVSAITVAEMTTNEEDSEKIKRIMRVLNSKNVEFVDFDLDVSIAFNSRLRQYLNSGHLHEKAKEIGFKTGDYAMAREWITKDYMIIMCGLENNSDVILTADKNTFYPIAKDITNSNCVLTYSELFESSEQFIIKYKEDEVEAFIATPIKNPSSGKEKNKKPIGDNTKSKSKKEIVAEAATTQGKVIKIRGEG